MNNQKNTLLPSLLFLVVVAALVLVVGRLSSAPAKQLSYSEVLDLFETEQVESFVLEGSTLTLTLRDADANTSSPYAKIGDTETFHKDLDALIAEQSAGGVLTSYDYLPEPPAPWYRAALPYVLAGLALLFVWVLMQNRAGGGPAAMSQFTRADARLGPDKRDPVTFDDVAGADEEKAELQQIVDFLRDPKRFAAMGARVPRGVLLVGPPGTGKTLLARAVAGEADVSFFSISGSDFVELYVGVGASRVRDLFQQAKKLAPSIVFIDEIDAVGRQRGAGLGGGHDEREQTLNQLLVEMDGFGKNEGVIVMAATNRKDILDPALLRPGRFDRQIYIGAPDWRGREEILRVHAKDKPIADDVDFEALAKTTAGFTGADLANLVNEAALLAVEREHPAVTRADLEQSMIKVIAGPEKRSRIVSPNERKLTAYHEAGHAVAMYHLPTQDPVHQITIVPRGGAGGMTISLPQDDRSYASRNELFDEIVALLGGRVAEQIMLDDISTGASNDLRRATALAREMITKYGMSERIGPVSYAEEGEIFVGRSMEKTKPYSERIAGDIDAEVHELLQKAYDACARLLRENAPQLTQVAEFLLENETMDRAQFEAMMRGEPV
ncbi:MAG: ATP-dependent zinc metalloprotease FtsH [Clostridiales bacterium]|nr:ATP-dependent zinc metalloprotease FtsH [Clostridiales bacterium]